MIIEELGLNLSENEWSCLKEGVIHPDKLKDYPHHYHVSNRMEKHVLEARKSFLLNDFPETFFQLGIALHYLQDSYTSYPSYLPKHQEWEEWIDNSNLVPDIENLIKKKIKDSHLKIRYLDIAKQLFRDVRGPKETFKVLGMNDVKKSEDSIAHWIVDLNLAFQASYTIAKSVMGDKTDPALELILNNLKMEYENKLLDKESKSSESILRMATSLERLEIRLNECTGFFAPIEKFFIRRSLNKIELKLPNSWLKYQIRSHLLSVSNEFQDRKNKILKNNLNWYLTKVEIIDFNEVETELLSIDEVSEELERGAPYIRYRLSEEGVRSFMILDCEVLSRKDLKRIGIY